MHLEKPRFLTTRLIFVFATGFGLGYSPLASGTVGAVLGVGLSCLFTMLPTVWLEIIASALLTGMAIPLCDRAERIFANKDDHRIVADEYLTFPLCTIGVPVLKHPWLLAMAFVLNRLLDVLKPPPARRAQNLPGGLGVVLDDVISSLYALGLLHLGWWWLKTRSG